MTRAEREALEALANVRLPAWDSSFVAALLELPPTHPITQKQSFLLERVAARRRTLTGYLPWLRLALERERDVFPAYPPPPPDVRRVLAGELDVAMLGVAADLLEEVSHPAGPVLRQSAAWPWRTSPELFCAALDLYGLVNGRRPHNAGPRVLKSYARRMIWALEGYRPGDLFHGAVLTAVRTGHEHRAAQLAWRRRVVLAVGESFFGEG